MKKSVYLLLLVLMAGCNSLEDKISDYTEEQIKEEYGVEVNNTSVKEQEAVGSTLIIVLSALFGTRYDLTFETADDPKFKFTGSINENLEEFHENYIMSKHKYLLQHNQEYQEKINSLKNNGFSDIEIENYISMEEFTFRFYATYNGANVNVAESVDTLNEMASYIVQIPYRTSITITPDLDNNRYYPDIETKDYRTEELTDLKAYLNQQFEFIFKENEGSFLVK